MQNGVEVLRFGGLQTGSRPSPFQIVERCDMYRLRRYFPDSANDPSRPPVILVPPMMMSANVFDVTRDQGAVGVLHDLGVDPWVVDFGSPDRETGGLERTLSDHVVALSRVIDSVHAHTGREVHLAGYSQGGMFCYQTAAYRRSEGLASVITFGAARRFARRSAVRNSRGPGGPRRPADRRSRLQPSLGVRMDGPHRVSTSGPDQDGPGEVGLSTATP